MIGGRAKKGATSTLSGVHIYLIFAVSSMLLKSGLIYIFLQLLADM